ncbi:hypothetical protein E2C01_090700 [Portunus trituberculatus]|uniref:Uncharacterized protein n=1 Tax=Portunus trituberculatus TaxID=210409 RepID=A0A5B7JMG2_PORTR|nr:hypothetical protein [Portunus trituberculatus]
MVAPQPQLSVYRNQLALLPTSVKTSMFSAMVVAAGLALGHVSVSALARSQASAVVMNVIR